LSETARTFWRLLDTAEDFLMFGERTSREVPHRVDIATRDPAEQADASRSDGRAPSRGAPRENEAAPDQRPSAAGEDWEASADETAVRRRRLAMLEERVRACTRCPLHEGRMNAVPGQGVLDPLVMVVGEGPGADEDRRGLPFVGRAGQFLDQWLEAIDLGRERNAYIANIVKCRPPENRDPRPNESEACLPYLRDQIDLVRPRVILTVGRIASGILIGTQAGIGSLRGRTFYYNGIPLIPTYHPSGVLRDPDLKRPVWEDLKRLRTMVDGPVEPETRSPGGARD